MTKPYTQKELEAEWKRREEKYRLERLKLTDIYKLSNGKYVERQDEGIPFIYWAVGTIIVVVCLYITW